jgi:hypothetical protein
MVTHCPRAFSKRSLKWPADEAASRFLAMKRSRHFKESDTNSTTSTAATSSFDTPNRPTGASPYPTTKNWPRDSSRANSRSRAYGRGVHATSLRVDPWRCARPEGLLRVGDRIDPQHPAVQLARHRNLVPQHRRDFFHRSRVDLDHFVVGCQEHRGEPAFTHCFTQDSNWSGLIHSAADEAFELAAAHLVSEM